MHDDFGFLRELLDIDEPIVVVMRHPPHPAAQHLLNALGCGWVVDPVNGMRCAKRCGRPECRVKRSRMTDKVHASDGSLTHSEMQRREDAAADAAPMSAYCAVGGCDWAFEGSAAQCRDQSAQHRMQSHGARNGHGNSHADGRELLDRMDAGLPVADDEPAPEVDEAPVLEEVAAVADSSVSGSASVDRGEPERAATSPSTTLSPRATTQRAILEALAHGPLPVADVVAAVGKTRGTVEQTLATMLKASLIRRVERGVYEATSPEREPQAAQPPAEQPNGSQSTAGPTAAASVERSGATPSRSEDADPLTPDQGGAAAAIAALAAAARTFADTLEQLLAAEAGSR